jgi:predicted amidohydrolase YtcJ
VDRDRHERSTRIPGRRRRAADLLVFNGSVLVMDERSSRADAVAIADGRVIAAGRIDEARRLVDRRTELLDAGGGTVLPGINDSHLHLSGFGLTFPPYAVHVDTETIEQLVAVVHRAVGEARDGAWIRGIEWNDNRLPRAPDRRDLDPVSGGHPVVLTDFSLHAVSVNTVVLRLAGITRDTVPPAGGVIEKDDAGEPTGVLRETARQLLDDVIPAFTPDEVSAAIDASLPVLHAQGITSVTDPGIDLDVLALYAEKARAGRLPLRVTALLLGGRSPADTGDMLSRYEPLDGIDPLALRVAGVKIWADGIPTAAQTAWLNEPYVDGSNGSMLLVGTDASAQVANLHEMIRLVHEAGFQVGIHATGDATIDAVVEGYLKVLGNGVRGRPRHYVIHADLASRETLTAMARHGIGANMNATIKYLLGRTLDPVLGPERTSYQWPYRTALDLGVRVSSASDAPVTFPSWLQGVMSAMLREGKFGGVAGEEERITLEEALATYTRAPAWQDFAEDSKGALAPGYVGDLCVLDADLERIDPHDFVDVPVNATVVGGAVVHERAGPRLTRPESLALEARGAKQPRGLRSYLAGVCCCALTHRLRAGLV